MDSTTHAKPQGTSDTTREPQRCHECGVAEGQLHTPGCFMEHCPFCGGQLWSCGCAYKILDIDISEGTWAYEHGLTEAQKTEWEKRLQAKGLIPFILYPPVCGRCGELWPQFFHVADEEWANYIPIRERRKILCRACYEEIEELIDNARQQGGPQK